MNNLIVTRLIKSESLAKLAPAMVAAFGEMPGIEFDAKNSFLGNKFASLKAVIVTTRPVLAKHKLAILQLPYSGEGNTKKEGPVNLAEKKNDPPEWEQQKTERQGVESIGVTTLLLHESGEYLGLDCSVSLTIEKGKSMAQISGSIITYLRRYGWSALLGLYSDEDVDGNDSTDPRGGVPDRFEDAQPRGGGVQSGTPPTKSSPQPAPASALPAKADSALVAQLRKLIGPAPEALAEWERCLNTRTVNTQGQVALNGTLADLSDAWAKFFVDKFQEEAGKVEMWCMENPAGAKPVEVPRDENLDPHSPTAAWRAYPMPWGQNKNVPLAKLEKNYLFGLWANYKVTPKTTQGRDKNATELAADRKFREMLDEAGKHYEFHT